MLESRKLTTSQRFLFWIAAMSLAMAHPGLTAMAQTSSAWSDGNSQSTSATSRSVSFSENGKTVSISEDSRSGNHKLLQREVFGRPISKTKAQVRSLFVISTDDIPVV